MPDYTKTFAKNVDNAIKLLGIEDESRFYCKFVRTSANGLYRDLLGYLMIKPIKGQSGEDVALFSQYIEQYIEDWKVI